MKALVVTNMYPSADRPAYGSFIKTQVDSLIARGIEVEILYIRGYKTPLYYLWGIFQIWWICSTRRFDLVHAHYGLSGVVARAQLRYPVLISYCGNDIFGHADQVGVPTRSSLIVAWFLRQLARLVSGVIVKSKAMANLLPIDDAEVIPNGVDFETFRPLDKIECRRSLGLALDKKYVLFPYKGDRPRKNFSAVKRAVELLKERLGDVEILTVHGQPNTRIPLFMNAADTLVLPSFWEGSPNAVKEALACNLRVVASDVGDVRELIQDLPGCAICGTNAEDIAEKLFQILTGPENSEGRESISHLRIEAVADRVIAKYHALVKC